MSDFDSDQEELELKKLDYYSVVQEKKNKKHAAEEFKNISLYLSS